MSTPITNIKIADPKPNRLVATAAHGHYLKSPGHASQVIALDAMNRPNEHLEIGRLYAIAADGMPTTLNMQFDHTQHTENGTLYVFYELVAGAQPGGSSRSDLGRATSPA